MAHLNHKGPEEKGPKTGRMLGKCDKKGKEITEAEKYEFGRGMGKKNKEGCGKGKGLRLKSSEIFDK